jgi:hypothetical protein
MNTNLPALTKEQVIELTESGYFYVEEGREKYREAGGSEKVFDAWAEAHRQDLIFQDD